ncbi:MAG: undecaprenyl-diphosphate phosphatase [Geminicoccaceae bacterium]|nr:undecaprenyl-diphosphate phosphatase [Geminicoccaceae bacterium]
MTDLQIAVLALIQGITEFLPISSSAHLVLVPALTGWPDQGLMIDIAVHVGSLGAVLLYFRDDVGLTVRGALEAATGERRTFGARLAVLIGLATIPVVVAGLALKTVTDDGLRSVALIGAASLFFGILLHVVDRMAPRRRNLVEMTRADAVTVGLAQALALIPGTSRAGITITAARALGYERAEAARFSMLLAIPTVLGAGTLLVIDLIELNQAGVGRDAVLAAVLAFAAAYGSIVFLMRWLKFAGFLPFVIYRCTLGAVLLIWALA